MFMPKVEKESSTGDVIHVHGVHYNIYLNNAGNTSYLILKQLKQKCATNCATKLTRWT